MRQVSLRCSEGLIVVGTLKCLARIDATLFIEDVAPILLHSVFYLVDVTNRGNRGRVLGVQCLEARVSSIPQMGETLGSLRGNL